MNKINIGDCYYQLSNYDSAKEWYKKASEVPVKTELDKQHQNDAIAKLKKCDSWW